MTEPEENDLTMFVCDDCGHGVYEESSMPEEDEHGDWSHRCPECSYTMTKRHRLDHGPTFHALNGFFEELENYVADRITQQTRIPGHKHSYGQQPEDLRIALARVLESQRRTANTTEGEE